MDNRMRLEDRRLRLESTPEERENFARRLESCYGPAGDLLVWNDHAPQLYSCPGLQERDGTVALALVLVRRSRTPRRANWGQSAATFTVDSGWVVPFVVVYRIGTSVAPEEDWEFTWLAGDHVLEGESQHARVFWGWEAARQFLLTTPDYLFANHASFFLEELFPAAPLLV